MADERIHEIRSLLPRGMLTDWVRLGSRLVRLLRDQRHGPSHDLLLNRLLHQARASVDLRERRAAQIPRVGYPELLPITPRKDEIIQAIRSHQVVVIAGETGSGKTTQIPKMCLEAGLGIEAKIGCTQPRRVAALSISRRIAEELNVSWGVQVGCKIRFDDRVRPETYIKVMTDGILLAETQGDPLLAEYDALIIDEAHERSLNIDFLLGYLKGLLQKRPQLKLIITSATIDTEAFSHAFGNAPVIEVSGRLFPVEVIYDPIDPGAEERGETNYIDAAVQAAERVLGESRGGDVLIFMPGERDIRETSDWLKSRCSSVAEIIPLFGRLASGDQQRVFTACARRKIVVATNIAETSLTIPGIRYVIDPGLARISRYNPRTRIKRLPIEPIAQSSAEQRKGRSGRVQNGVCIRLYSEDDYGTRPRFTQPEIQRANLAEVILRMKAFRLGEIENFPFINPPLPAAIQGGYKLLQELGAVDEAHDLTPLGRDLARLPIDPTLGRMLLQAQREHAIRELLIIAAGLSIQDPRERPLGQRDTAASAHQQFADPQSDFLTLLNIWNAVHEKWEILGTQNQRRKFCKSTFLSYVRMREWQDLHAQLLEALGDLGRLELNEERASYSAIHRSILAGLLGHVAVRQGVNLYKGGGNREVAIFPGSILFAKGEKRKKPAHKPVQERAPVRTGQPEWVVAGEIVETSRLFIRMVGGIDPLWIVDLGAHLSRVTHQNPRWSAAAGQVLAEEITTLFGLEVRRRSVAFGNVDARQATEIFVRSALVEGHLFPAEQSPGGQEEANTEARATERIPRVQHEFLEDNKRLRQKIEVWQTRMRRHDLVDLDEAFFKFYLGRVSGISSVHELNRLLGDLASRKRLCATEADLVGESLSYDAQAFPDCVTLGGHPAPLSYSYSPGEEEDGVTVTLDFTVAQVIPAASVEWAVPGLREAQISELLRALPKAIRRQLMPLTPKVAEILKDFHPSGKSLKHDLATFVSSRYGVQISAASWAGGPISNHVRPRVRVTDHKQRTVAVGRDLNELRQKLEQVKIEPAADPPGWNRLTEKWERFGLTSWTLGNVPERVEVSDPTGPLCVAWPGLQVEEGQVNLRLFRSQELARQSSPEGIRRLVEMELQKDLGWLQKDLRAVSRCEPLIRDFCSVEALQTAAYASLKRHLLSRAPFEVLTEERFRAAVDQARGQLHGLAPQMLSHLETIFTLRQEILRRYGPLAERQRKPVQSRTLSGLNQLTIAAPLPAPKTNLVASELEALMAVGFLEVIPFDKLNHLPRYLKALLLRAERARMNPLRDSDRTKQVAPYLAALRRVCQRPSRSSEAALLVEEFRWMIEEFKVSVFAQELGTAFPVSAKRLDQQLARIAELGDA